MGKDLKSDVYEPLMDGQYGNRLFTNAAMKNQVAQHMDSLLPETKADINAQAEQTRNTALEKQENHKRFKDNLVQINVSLGSQKSKQVFENHMIEYVGGTLASNGTIDIEAKSAADTKGSIKAIAETIKGKKVNLSATKDVSLEAAENTYDSQFTNTSSGWSLLAGGSDRLPSDHGGHLIASMFGGSGKLDNLVAMDGNVNQSAFKRLENEWKGAIQKGKSVDVTINVKYPDKINERPEAFNVTFFIDGVKMTTDLINKK